MNYFRFKLVGFGLAVLAGSAIASDDNQPASGDEKGTELENAAKANMEPPRLPPEIRFNSVAVSPNDMVPFWFSASKPTAAVVPAASTSNGPVTAAVGIDFQSGKVINASSIPVTNLAPAVIACSYATTPGTFGMNPFLLKGEWSLQPFQSPVAMLWKRSASKIESWPPAGPLIGIVVPDPIPDTPDLHHTSETTTNLQWTKETATQPSPERWRQSLNNSTTSNVPALPTLVQTPAISQPTQAPKQSSISDLQASQPPQVVHPMQSPAQPATPPLPKVDVIQSPVPQQPAQPTQPPTQQLPMPQLLKTEMATQPTLPTQQTAPMTQTPPLPQLPKTEVVPQPSSQPGQPIPETAPSNLLPPPRTLTTPPLETIGPGICSPVQPQAVAELPAAPPELMVPLGAEVPGKKGVFGSEPIRISRDFPSLSDLCGTPVRDGLHGLSTNDQERAGAARGFIEGEYLMWWMRGLTVPVLATTSTNPTGTGFLGSPGTVPVIGSGTFLGSARDGLRLRAGLWLDDCNCWGIDGSIFFLGQRDADAAYGSNQFPVLTRPVFSPNPIPGTGTIIGETGEAVSVPGILAGALTVHAQSVLWGGDANVSRCLLNDCDSRATLFVGYRNLDLVESLAINENITVIGSGGGRIVVTDPIGTMVHVQDKFATQNYFNGGQIGGTYERRWGRFDLDARASIAFGVTEQELNISGYQTVTLPGQATQTFRGGLLAVGPNLGDFTRDRFSVAPELTLNAGYWLTQNLKVHVGYNFLYWTNVIRPGEQIDRVVNLSYVPNAPAVGISSLVRPEALFQQSNMLVHGVQFGIEWRW